VKPVCLDGVLKKIASFRDSLQKPPSKFVTNIIGLPNCRCVQFAVAPSVHSEARDRFGEAQVAIEEWRQREEVKINRHANGELYIAVPEIAVDSSSEIQVPRADVDKQR